MSLPTLVTLVTQIFVHFSCKIAKAQSDWMEIVWTSVFSSATGSQLDCLGFDWVIVTHYWSKPRRFRWTSNPASSLLRTVIDCDGLMLPPFTEGLCSWVTHNIRFSPHIAFCIMVKKLSLGLIWSEHLIPRVCSASLMACGKLQMGLFRTFF